MTLFEPQNISRSHSCSQDWNLIWLILKPLLIVLLSVLKCFPMDHFFKKSVFQAQFIKTKSELLCWARESNLILIAPFLTFHSDHCDLRLWFTWVAECEVGKPLTISCYLFAWPFLICYLDMKRWNHILFLSHFPYEERLFYEINISR